MLLTQDAKQLRVLKCEEVEFYGDLPRFLMYVLHPFYKYNNKARQK
jgi:hypothetical protein